MIRPAFATHNAYTVAVIKQLAQGRPFEFQRLHGMGEEVFGALHKIEGNTPTPVRIYAPVGGHKELLAYLVRRLLENGANTSFVNRMGDADIPAQDLVGDPVAELARLDIRRNPAIPLPRDILGADKGGRLNSAGIDLSDPLVLGALQKKLDECAKLQWHA